MFKLLGLVLFFFNAFSYACSFPTTGKKYDDLVKVKTIKHPYYVNETVHVFTFPDIVEQLKLSSSDLSVYLSTDNVDSPYIRQPIKLENKDGMMTGVAFSNKEKGLTLYLNISWGPSSPGMCPVDVTKKLL